MMKVVIIGNGVAGTFAAQHIRNQDKKIKIEIYSEEKYPYYTRIKLPELISEKMTIDDMIVFKPDWYEKNKIKTFLSKKVIKIIPGDKQLIIEGETEPVKYDKLVIATVSFPNIPPIKNAQEMLRNGVFALRTIDDALEIRKYIKENNAKTAAIIGGGLLGLELAKQIRDCGLKTTVVEFFPRLLPKQLDVDCGGLLKEEIEQMGIKDGREIKADIVLIQAGIRPTIKLAQEAKIETNKGIIINHFLKTKIDDIYAVGDCIEFNKQIYGIIPACLEQAKILAYTIKGSTDTEYKGTVPKTTLKIVGIDLTSIGIYDPEDKELVGAGWRIMKAVDKKGGCYKKIVLDKSRLKGAILFGEKKAIPYVNRNLDEEIEEKELRQAIDMYRWICGGCGNVYDEAKMEIMFKDLPPDWKCPNCKAPKDKFNIEE